MSLELRNYNFIDQYEVNDVEIKLLPEEKEGKEHHDAIKGAPSHSLGIRSVVDPDLVRDRLYFGGKTNEDNEVELRAPTGAITVMIKPGDSVDRENINAEGVFWGNIGHSDFEPEEDDIWLELYLPIDQFQAIADRIHRQPEVITQLLLRVRSFTFEVDDFLREPWHPQDIFISGGMDIAFVQSVRQYVESVKLKKTDDDDHYEDSGEDSYEADEQSMAQLYAQRFGEYATAMTTVSGWALAWVAFKSLFVLAITVFMLVGGEFIAAGLFALVATIMQSNFAISSAFGKVPNYFAHKIALDSAQAEHDTNGSH